MCTLRGITQVKIAFLVNSYTHSPAYIQFYPDRAVQRDVMDVLVKCIHHTIGCPWTGHLKNLEVRDGTEQRKIYVGGYNVQECY